MWFQKILTSGKPTPDFNVDAASRRDRRNVTQQLSSQQRPSLKELVRLYPDDVELGRAIRRMFGD
jgi:hypothetical protein